MSNVTSVKKITMKGMGVKPVSSKLPKDGSVAPLLRVIGQATGTKSGTTNFGPWTALSGLFAATNIGSGETVRSSVLFLPDVAMQDILGALPNGNVEFGCIIGARLPKEGEFTPTGYLYTVEWVTAPGTEDPLARLMLKFEAPKDDAPEGGASKSKGGKGTKGGAE